MQIRKVEVENYRSLKKVTMPSLNRINMLYGYNNTGKSNFLRFIELAFRRKVRLGSIKYAEGTVQKEERTEDISGWWEGEFRDKAYMFTDDKRGEAITFVIGMEVAHSELGELQKTLATEYLAKNRVTAYMRFEGTIRSVTYDESEILLTKVTINRHVAYNPSAKEESLRYFPSTRLAGQAETLNSLLAIFNDCVLFLGSDRYLSEESELSDVPGKLHAKNAKNWLFEQYMDSQKYTKFREFIAFVKAYQSKHIEDDAAKHAWRQWPFSTGDVGFGRFGKSIDVMLRNAKGRFPLASYGTGVQQILYLLAKLFFTSARIILIEEIELNLSPTAQRELFINLQRLQAARHLDQVLFTTHSNYFNYRGDFRIFEAVLDENGYTNIQPKRAARKDFFGRTLID